MRKAFTMIELLVVIGLIGVLMATLAVSFSGGTESARAAQCLANMKSLANGVQAYVGGNGRYPLAGSLEGLGFDESQGVRNVKKVYSEWKGWISWNSRETYRSRPQNHSSSMSWFTSTYSTDLDAREFALTNGAIWTAMSGSATCYRCPNHTRVLKGSNPNWSYVMNAFFGWDYSLGSDAVAVNDPRLMREYVTRADRRLLFAEIPYASYTGDTPNTDSGSGTACDCVLQYKGTGPNPESIGFNHKSGRDITAHIVFADGHAEKLLYKEKQDVQELTRWLCEARDVAYNASSGRYEELK